MCAEQAGPRVAGSGAVVAPFLVDGDTRPFASHEPAAELALFYHYTQRLCLFAGERAAPSVRTTIVPDVRLTDPDELRGGEDVEILAATPDSPLWLRVCEPFARSTRMMPLSGQRRMPWALGRTVSGYGFDDGSVAVIEPGPPPQLALARANGRIERRPIEYAGQIRGGWLFSNRAERGLNRVFAQRVEPSGLGPRHELGIFAHAGEHPLRFDLRGAGDPQFLAIGISHGDGEPQLATTFFHRGRWQSLVVHDVDSLTYEVGFARGAGTVAWKDDNMFSGTGSRDIVSLTARVDGTSVRGRHPPLPASDYLSFSVVPLGERLLALSLDEPALMARLAATEQLGRAREQAVLMLPDGLWSFTAHARDTHALVIVRESESERQYALEIDESGLVTAVQPVP